MRNRVEKKTSSIFAEMTAWGAPNERTHVFPAQDLTPGPQRLEKDENLQPHGAGRSTAPFSCGTVFPDKGTRRQADKEAA